MCIQVYKMEEIKYTKIFNNKTFHRIMTQNSKQLLKKYIEEEICMNQFQQSGCESTHIPHKQQQETREGDWICVRCNNLNFSFRKKCNRCKAQTKQENFQQIQQAYQYYQEYYRQFNPQQCSQSQNSDTKQPLSTNMNSQIFDPQYEIEDTFYEDCWGFDLPSVSPIIRRYKKEKTSPKTQISQAWSSDEQSIEGSQYLKKYCWQNIMIEDDIQNESLSRETYDVWDKEIQKIVQRVVL